MSTWLVYTLVFVAGFILVSVWSFWLAIHPPKLTSDLTPEDFSLPYEAVTITASDGTELAGWLFASEQSPDRIVVVLHGYPADKSDMLGIAAALYPDVSVLLMDLRHFGESDGAYTTLGVKERGDIEAVLDFVVERGYGRVGMFGFSLGGALSLMTAADDDRVDAVASYAAYANLRTLGHETYSMLWLLKYPLVELMKLHSKLLFGTPATSVSPEGAAADITVPVFLIHTKADEQIDFAHAARLKDALSHNEQLETYFPETGRHGELPLDFTDRLLDFFDRTL